MSPTTLKEHKAPIILSIAVILAYELLFLMAPIELEYLLPLLPFTLILLRICLPGKDTYFFVFFLFIVTANFIWINPARSTTPNQTSQVVYGLWLDKGYLLQDITTRLAQLMP